MTHLNATAKRDNVVHGDNRVNPDGLTASPRDNSDRRSTGIGKVNGAWLGRIGEEARPRKLSSRVRPMSAGTTRGIRFPIPRVGAGNFWIGILIGTAIAGLVTAII